jgi:hypothetical protein
MSKNFSCIIEQQKNCHVKPQEKDSFVVVCKLDDLSIS